MQPTMPKRPPFAAVPLGLGLLLFASACDPEVAPDDAESLEQQPPVTVAPTDRLLDPSTECSLDHDPVPLRVHVLDVPEDGRRWIAADGVLRVQVQLDEHRHGTVALHLDRRSEHGHRRDVVATAEIEPHGVVQLELSAATLGLGGSPTTAAGRLGLTARLTSDDGSGITSPRLDVLFHQRENGVVVFGAQAQHVLAEDRGLPEPVAAHLHARLEQGPSTLTLPNGTTVSIAPPVHASFIPVPAALDLAP